MSLWITSSRWNFLNCYRVIDDEREAPLMNECTHAIHRHTARRVVVVAAALLVACMSEVSQSECNRSIKIYSVINRVKQPKSREDNNRGPVVLISGCFMAMRANLDGGK